MPAPRLTYLVNTYNKLPFLRHALPRLLDEVEDDEEVVVVDGSSSDGTQDFIASLQKDHRIDQFTSEKDAGEAHGWNRGMLRARGDLIKLISDDDVFHYPAIRVCRTFMEDHPEIDVLWSQGAGLQLGSRSLPSAGNDGVSFRRWKEGKGPLFLCGLGLMFRRSSLAMTGLFNTSSKRIDAELSLRLSTSRCKQVWYASPLFVRLENPQSNAVKFGRRMLREEVAFKASHHLLSGTLPRLDETVGLARLSLRSALSTVADGVTGGSRKLHNPCTDGDIETAYDTSAKWLAEEFSRSSLEACFE
ncbi:MAG: glycosyltransferase [Myxococcales bacterium]|nr:glycosyltransferase [Myxococcales bacterium]